MTDSSKLSSEVTEAVVPKKAFRKGALIKVNRSAYLGSIESEASDPSPPEYIFKGPGEILSVKGDYAQIRFRMPVPDIWLHINQIEPWS